MPLPSRESMEPGPAMQPTWASAPASAAAPAPASAAAAAPPSVSASASASAPTPARCRRGVSFGALVLASLLAAGAAQAFAPPEPGRVGPILRPGQETPPLWTTEALDARRRPEAAAFAAAAGGSWRVQWNHQTGTPHAAFGSGLELGGPVETPEQAAEVALRFAGEHRSMFGVDPQDLVLRSSVRAMGKWGVVFQQTHHGVPVIGARASMVLTEGGRLFFFGSDCQPDLDVNRTPSITAAMARDLAARALGVNAANAPERVHPRAPGPRPDGDADLLILPGLRAGDREGHLSSNQASDPARRAADRLVWRNRIMTEDPYAIWVSYVDAHDGTILWRTNEVCYADLHGTTRGMVEDFGYCYREEDRPMPHLLVNLGEGGVTWSDEEGVFSRPYDGDDPVTVTAGLLGSWVNVRNMMGPNAQFTGVFSPNDPIEILWTDANAHDAERDVYLHANRTHDLIKLYDPEFGYPDYSMPANVNIAASCNAFWDGNSINFYRASGGCGNTGQMGDVIYHEYGHGLTQWIYGDNPDDVGEGNSDVLGLLIDGNPVMGEGFYLGQCTNGIRTADNELRYPDDYRPGQIHYNGQIISGFWWDARAGLIETVGEEGVRDVIWPIWNGSRRLLQPMNMPDQVLAAFVADDDDGNLANGTPHYDVFCRAAERHGLEAPGPDAAVTFGHEPLRSKVWDGEWDRVVATVVSGGGEIDPASVTLVVRVDDGEPHEYKMRPTGRPDEYTMLIRPQAVGRHVDYAMYASDDHGNSGAFPASGCVAGVPEVMLRYYIASEVDELEAESGWTVGAAGDDATSGIWVRGDPNGTFEGGRPVQPEDDATPHPGVSAWFTGQCEPGCESGQADVDNGSTTLYSPVIDFTGSNTGRVIYHRWYSNDAGSSPGNDSWVVDASNDGGVNWVNVESTTASQTSWVAVDINLNALFSAPPQQVQFRFIASDLGPGSLIEAAVDDFLVFRDDVTAVELPSPMAGRPALTLESLWPNPVSSSATIVYLAPAGERAELAVHDVAGRLLRILDGEGRGSAIPVPVEASLGSPPGAALAASPGASSGALSGASQGASSGTLSGAVSGSERRTVTWDLRDGAGRLVGPGVYYVRLEGGGMSTSRKIVVR